MEITSRSQEREPTNPIPSPRPSPRPDNPNPTTFVQADTASFKQVVQMLTGSTPKPATSSPDPTTTKPHPPIRSTGVKKNKLYERRNSLKNGLMINPTAGIPPRGGEILSPSMLNFPGLVLSPVTPLIEDPFERSSPSVGSSSSEEERAIAEKGFYLHPSPRTAAGTGAEPRLLPLFPVTSPRVAAESSSN